MLIGLLLLDMYKQYSPPIFLQKKTLRFCSLPSISLSSTVNTFLFVFFYTLVQLLLIPSRFPALTFCRITLYDRSTSYNSAYRVAKNLLRQPFHICQVYMYILHWLFILHFSSFFFPVASSFHAASLELAIIIP